MIRADGAIRLARPLFQAGDGGSKPTSALELWIEPIAFTRARELNRAWHSILPKFGTGFIEDQNFPCFAAVCPAGVIYAVAIWSNPAARKLPQVAWLELRRLAIAEDAPAYTASRMLRIMRMLLHRKRPHVERVISYQSKGVHAGTIYRADGWRPVAECKGDTWNRPKRPRPESQQIDDRVRWERPIVGPPDTPSAPPAQKEAAKVGDAGERGTREVGR